MNADENDIKSFLNSIAFDQVPETTLVVKKVYLKREWCI